MEASHSNPERSEEDSLQGQVAYSLLIQPSSPLALFSTSHTLTLLYYHTSSGPHKDHVSTPLPIAWIGLYCLLYSSYSPWKGLPIGLDM